MADKPKPTVLNVVRSNSVMVVVGNHLLDRDVTWPDKEGLVGGAGRVRGLFTWYRDDYAEFYALVEQADGKLASVQLHELVFAPLRDPE
jgi:hypothetical protein